VAARTEAVEARRLGKSFDERPVLIDVSFRIPPGQFAALLGANGAGKTTLLKIISTLVTPSSGELMLFGQPLRRDSASLRRRLGVIGHNPMLYRDLTALENLLFFGRLYGVHAVRQRAKELLEFVDLAGRARDPVRTFSRGMTQRLAIARALMHEPDLLIADEPFAGLDAPSTRMLENMLLKLRDEGNTIVMANHDIGQSLELAEHAIVLRIGRVVLDEPTSSLREASVLAEVAGS
jgi:ABC-type multidrug transport system ATPase subunit